jgi:hypothetical protein
MKGRKSDKAELGRNLSKGRYQEKAGKSTDEDGEEGVTAGGARLMTLVGSQTNSSDLMFFGIFATVPSHKWLKDDAFHTWHPISLYRSSNAKSNLKYSWCVFK